MKRLLDLLFPGRAARAEALTAERWERGLRAYDTAHAAFDDALALNFK